MSKGYKRESTLLTTIFQYSTSSQLREDLCSQLAGLKDHWPYVLVQESKSWILLFQPKKLYIHICKYIKYVSAKKIVYIYIKNMLQPTSLPAFHDSDLKPYVVFLTPSSPQVFVCFCVCLSFCIFIFVVFFSLYTSIYSLPWPLLT